MKTVVLSGYYGFNNAGDEAILAAILRGLKESQEDLRFIVLSANPERTAREHGVEAYSRFSIWQILKAVWQADLLISGGGSLLQDVTGGFSIPYYLSVVKLAKLLGKRVMFYGQGVGPVERPSSRMLVKRVANSVDLITVRDKESEQLLEELGVYDTEIVVTADPVFQLPCVDKERIQPLLARYDLKGPLIGLSLRQWPEVNTDLELLAGELDSFLERTGGTGVFVAMQYPADLNISKELAGLMKSRVVVVQEELSLDDLLSLFAHLDFMVGMRLHALILALQARVPVAGLSYDPKIDRLLSSFSQYPVASVDGHIYDEHGEKVRIEKGSLQLAEQLWLKWQERDSQKKTIEEKTKELKESSLLDRELALKLLGYSVISASVR